MGLILNKALNLEYLCDFQILAGCNGFDKIIKTVGMLEDESIDEIREVFYEGDFVLTTFYQFKDNPEKLMEVIKSFNEANVTALAIKNKYYKELPVEVIEYANSVNLPLFMYNKDICTENLVYTILQALKDEDDNTYLASKVYGILSGNMSKQVVEKIAKEINNNFNDNVLVAYYKVSENIKTAISMINNGPYREKYSSALMFKDGVLIITSTNKNEMDIVKFFQKTGIDYENIPIGTSSKLYTLGQLDIAINEALYAYIIAELNGSGILNYNQLGLFKMILPIMKVKSVIDFKNSIILPIKEYDTKYNATLYLTSKAFVENHGDYKKTAEYLYQHKNTVRYRIMKVKELLELNEAHGSFYEQLALSMRIDLLEKII